MKHLGTVNAERQEAAWNQNWKDKIHVDPSEILYSRFAREAYQCLKRFIDVDQDKMILEAGCGTGRFCCLLAREFPAMNVTGIDTVASALETAGRLKDVFQVPNVSFKRGNLFQIPFPDGYFDVVFNEGVIEHFPLKEKPHYIDAVKEMIRVTRKGGKIIIAVPNWYNFPHTLYKKILMILGKEYKYGYEKSFRHSDLLELFGNLELKGAEISGFYAAHGFYRLAEQYVHGLFNTLGELTDKIRNLLTERKRMAFDRRFGIEIMIRGIK